MSNKIQDLIFVITVGLFVIVSAMTKVRADEYGSYCINKNGVQHCTIWQWDSSQQKVIRKDVKRKGE